VASERAGPDNRPPPLGIAAVLGILIFDTRGSGSLAEMQVVALRGGGLERLTAAARLVEATGRTTLVAAGEKQAALEG